MRATIPALLVLISLLVACGGNQPQQQPPASTVQAPAAKPAAPEPPRRIPPPTAELLHGAPAPNEEDLSELYDVGQDLEDLAQGDADAASNLATDLARFTTPQAQGEVKSLTEDLGRALKGGTLTRDQSNKLAGLLYAAMNVDSMNASQRTALASDISSTLTAAGSAAPATSAVAARIGKIAAAVGPAR